jgi:DnaJ-class molecular chaperone
MPSQVKRLLLLFAMAAVVLILLRHFLIPRSFGRYGHYRADAVGAIAASGLRYSGHLVCAECHDDIANTKSASKHAPVTCEACHGPGYSHSQDPTENKISVPSGRERCGYCHNYDASRPTGFPQIDPAAHGADEPCASCHNPHQPELNIETPACDGCHTEIARTLSKGHHRNLNCTICHGSGTKHPVDPKNIKPEMPASRDFCAQCHAKNAAGPKNASGIENAPGIESAPRIDMATHGQDYLCWQCHFPHLPEARR